MAYARSLKGWDDDASSFDMQQDQFGGAPGDLAFDMQQDQFSGRPPRLPEGNWRRIDATREEFVLNALGQARGRKVRAKNGRKVPVRAPGTKLFVPGFLDDEAQARVDMGDMGIAPLVIGAASLASKFISGASPRYQGGPLMSSVQASLSRIASGSTAEIQALYSTSHNPAEKDRMQWLSVWQNEMPQQPLTEAQKKLAIKLDPAMLSQLALAPTPLLTRGPVPTVPLLRPPPPLALAPAAPSAAPANGGPPDWMNQLVSVLSPGSAPSPGPGPGPLVSPGTDTSTDGVPPQNAGVCGDRTTAV